jgi:sec-independent protein translocase protein TatB
MLDIGPSELLLIVIVAVIAIGPKELPAALRTAGRWIGQMRRMSAHFRSGLDAMIREAEMAELEKKWAEQNAKIIRDHPADAPAEMEPTGAYPSRPAPPPTPAEVKAETAADSGAPGEDPAPIGKPEA